MCPACVASAAWIAGSVMSTGGIATFAVRMVRGKKTLNENLKNATERRNDDGNDERNDDQRNND
jgi:hypothetical protein